MPFILVERKSKKSEHFGQVASFALLLGFTTKMIILSEPLLARGILNFLRTAALKNIGLWCVRTAKKQVACYQSSRQSVAQVARAVHEEILQRRTDGSSLSELASTLAVPSSPYNERTLGRWVRFWDERLGMLLPNVERSAYQIATSGHT